MVTRWFREICNSSLSEFANISGLLVSASMAAVSTAILLTDPIIISSSSVFVLLIAFSTSTGALTQLIVLSLLKNCGRKDSRACRTLASRVQPTLRNTPLRKSQATRRRNTTNGSKQRQESYTKGIQSLRECLSNQESEPNGSKDITLIFTPKDI